MIIIVDNPAIAIIIISKIVSINFWFKKIVEPIKISPTTYVYIYICSSADQNVSITVLLITSAEWLNFIICYKNVEFNTVYAVIRYSREQNKTRK